MSPNWGSLPGQLQLCYGLNVACHYWKPCQDFVSSVRAEMWWSPREEVSSCSCQLDWLPWEGSVLQGSWCANMLSPNQHEISRQDERHDQVRIIPFAIGHLWGLFLYSHLLLSAPGLQLSAVSWSTLRASSRPKKMSVSVSEHPSL